MGDQEPLKSPLREGPDLEERDYNMINEHLAVTFEDVFAEHEDHHSLPCVWNSSFLCFQFCGYLVYTVQTLCCGICFAVFASWEVGCAYFCQIWCGTPALKALHFLLILPRRIVDDCIKCMVKPCCEDMSAYLKAHLKS